MSSRKHSYDQLPDLGRTGRSPYVQPNLAGIVSKISWQARRKMFVVLMEMIQPTATTTVIDVGVTSDQREDSNFFEKLYPYPEKVIATGLEDASFLEKDLPGLTYIQTDGLSLPFADQSFDLAVSFAVIEHVGDREKQKAFLHELCRVGRVCCITTPNRWYPIEFHTMMPLLHWLPLPWFRRILKLIGKSFWAEENHLNPLSEKEILQILPANVRFRTRHHKLLGLVSNLLFIVENDV
ncbi:MAG: methyltransferase domain-containing protein [Leptolyngbyaceae cyanobacterium SL_7_1]|nr:methyltransferase domain-containing protein [Leptolyngbyaceae cyanobacterium SL_7_1]